MTSAEYRARAVELLTARNCHDLPHEFVEQAAVWAQLAASAAVTETQAAQAGEEN